MDWITELLDKHPFIYAILSYILGEISSLYFGKTKRFKENSLPHLVFNAIKKWIDGKKVGIMLLLIMFTSISCNTLEYENDTLIPSAFNDESLVSELVFKVSGSKGYSYCKDVENKAGNCIVNLQASRGFSINIEERDYAYFVDINCIDVNDTNHHWDDNFSIPKSAKQWIFSSSKQPKFQDWIDGLEKTGACSIRITPKDRSDVQIKGQVFLKVVQSDYLRAESIYIANWKKKKYIFLGSNAYRSYLCSNTRCKILKKKTHIKLKKKYKYIHVETFKGRSRHAAYNELREYDFSDIKENLFEGS